MPNAFFRFKQFTIYQDRCAMKVCTDACILGAWFSGRIPAGSLVLDIGSGTGLLMLMLAQRHDGRIQGIEFDPASFGQLQENITQSKWKDRLDVFKGDVRSFIFPGKYDFMIVNPPFFEDGLRSDSESKNLAKHSKALTLAELIAVIDANLVPSGSFGILLPDHRAEYFEELAEGSGLYLQEKLGVRQRPGHDFFRSVLHFSRNAEGPAPVSELTLRHDSNGYTREFLELMKAYYLYL